MARTSIRPPLESELRLAIPDLGDPAVERGNPVGALGLERGDPGRQALAAMLLLGRA